MNFAMVPGTHNELEIYNFLKTQGLDITIIPYQSNALQAAMRGDADLFLGQYVSMWPQAQAGKLVPLAYLGPQRYRLAPNVPTAREQGVDVVMEAWRGIAVPKGTPVQVVAALQAAIRKTTESPEFASATERLGVHPAFLPAGDFGELIAKEDAQLAELMQLIGLKK
jgi:tripartite-type tricarboxylate transporter receptor subunit TctC